MKKSLMLFVMIALITPFTSCSNNLKAIDAEHKTILNKKVEVIRPLKKKIPIKIEIASTLNAEESSVLAAEVSGILVKWYVKENQSVKKGAPILKIDPINYERQRNQAVAGLKALESQYAALEKDYGRLKRLVEKDAVPQQKLDALEGQFEALRNQIAIAKEGVELAQRMVTKTIVRAPYTGVITERKIKTGEFVAAGAKPVAQIIKTDKLEAKLNVSEMFYDKVDKNSQITFELPSLNKTIKGEFISKSKNIDNLKQFKIIVNIDNSKNNIPAGIYAIARIVSEEKERTLLPNSSLKQIGQNRVAVYTVNKKGIVQSVKLTSSIVFEDGVEVTGDIPEFVIKDISSTVVGEKVQHTLK